MRIVKRKVLVDFGQKHPQARGAVEHWRQLIKAGQWRSPADAKTVFGGGVDFVGSNRAVFDIKGNDYRLIAEINYHTQIVFIRFLGTHTEYDRVDAATVRLY
jgi:mRNA interferase HigB